MKTLTLKTGEVPEGGDDPLSYDGFIRACLDHTTIVNGRRIGFTRQDLKERDRIEKALDQVNGEGKIELEDADAENLKRIVDAMAWGIRHPLILEFCDDVEAL